MIGRITSLVCAALIAGDALGQSTQSNELLNGIDHALGRGGDRAPTIDEILGDVLDRVQGLDRMSAQAAAGRLRESERELALYETLLKQVRGGLLVEVPKAGGPGAPVSEEAVAIERKKVDELARRLREAEAARSAAATSRPAQPAEKVRPSRMADAILDVAVDVPAVAPKKAGVAPALDPEGLSRALFAAGDYAGTLDALGQIPDGALRPEDRYRRARSLDQLGRLAEAKSAYEAVAASDKEGPWGRQAAWMLKLARTREQVAGALLKTDSKAREEKKK
jgi:hypothetical protein